MPVTVIMAAMAECKSKADDRRCVNRPDVNRGRINNRCGRIHHRGLLDHDGLLNYDLLRGSTGERGPCSSFLGSSGE